MKHGRVWWGIKWKRDIKDKRDLSILSRQQYMNNQVPCVSIQKKNSSKLKNLHRMSLGPILAKSFFLPKVKARHGLEMHFANKEHNIHREWA